MTSMSRSERAALCDLALALGPDAPTLCDGWDVRALVVHLLVREGNPLAAPGILLSPLARVTERVSEDIARRHDFETLVERLRTGPPFYSPLGWGKVDSIVNLLEFFVHHEDVRRAQPTWEPRRLTRRQQDSLWVRGRVAARKLVADTGVEVVLERADTGERTRVRSGSPAVVVRGLPAELVLFVYGRDPQVRVEYDGSADAVERMRAASHGL